MMSKSLVNVVFFSLWIGVCLFFMQSVILPIMLGIIISTVFYPLYNKIQLKIKSYALSAMICIGIFLVFFLIPSLLVMSKLATVFMTKATTLGVNWMNPEGQFSKMIINSELFKKIVESVPFSKAQLNDFFIANLSSIKAMLLSWGQSVFLSIPQIALVSIVIISTIYVSLTQGKKALGFLESNPFFSKGEMAFFIKTFSDVSYSVIVATVLGGAVQAVLMMVPSFFFHISFSFTIGVMTFLFSFLPTIGTAPVSIFMVVYSFMTGNLQAAIIYSIFGIIVALADNVVSAFLIGRNIQIHPYVVFVSAIGGLFTLGIYGLIMAPVITISFIKIYDSCFVKKEKHGDIIL